MAVLRNYETDSVLNNVSLTDYEATDEAQFQLKGGRLQF